MTDVLRGASDEPGLRRMSTACVIHSIEPCSEGFGVDRHEALDGGESWPGLLPFGGIQQSCVGENVEPPRAHYLPEKVAEVIGARE